MSKNYCSGEKPDAPAEGAVMKTMAHILAASLFFVLISVSISPALALQGVPKPEFDMPDENTSTSGHVRVVWTLPEPPSEYENVRFELQQAKDPDFATARTRYTGQDLASFISGLPDGNYHYRVRTLKDGSMSEWSDPLVVKVEHQSLQLAFTLFGLGAVVFLATLFLVIHGTRTTETE